jgi:hypothetical protein
VSNSLLEILWAPETGLFRQVVSNCRDPNGAAVVAALEMVPKDGLWDISTVRALWTIPSVYLHRRYADGGNAWAEIFNATEPLAEPYEMKVEDAPLQELKAFWDPRQGGFLGMLRRPELGYSGPALEKFLAFLDAQPPLQGQVSRTWATELDSASLRCWSCWRAGTFAERIQLQHNLLPRLAKILGEPYPGHIQELLEFSNLTEADMPK